MRFHVPNMKCGGCARGVTKAIQGVDPQARIEADPSTHRVTILSDHPGTAFLPALEAAGFPATRP